MNWILYGLSIPLSGVLYRLGGWGDEGRAKFPKLPKWLFDTKARDIGCALTCGAVMITSVSVGWWIHLLAFMLLFGALTTYWDFIFGYDNHYVHGLACGIAYFPYAIGGAGSVGILIRSVVVCLLMGMISAVSEDDVVEEVGRGMVLALTLPLLLID